MIVVVGVSHRSAPLAVRESLAVPKEKISEALRQIREDTGLLEAVLLSTCNRVEVYGRQGDGPGVPVEEALCRLHARPLESLAGHLYRLEGEAAVRHAFRVAASLDSMVIGEPQILGQVKEAYERAEEAGALGSVLAALRNRSVGAAKRARTETGIGKNAVSISSVAVELARKIFGDLRDRQVLLVGAGKMSELAARQLVTAGAQATVLGGRRFERAEELARALGGRAIPFENLRNELARAEIVISGTGAPGFVIERADVEAVLPVRRGRPLFLIDIAVPRDVDPEVRQISGVFLYDLDDLRSVADANLRERRKEAAAAEALVEEEVLEFLAWRRSLDAVPLLVELRRRGDEIRRGELDKARRRLGGLTADQEQAIEAATQAMVNKLLHPATVMLKDLAKNGESSAEMSLVRKLLGL